VTLGITLGAIGLVAAVLLAVDGSRRATRKRQGLSAKLGPLRRLVFGLLVALAIGGLTGWLAVLWLATHPTVAS
jgi:hypothetical protein